MCVSLSLAPGVLCVVASSSVVGRWLNGWVRGQTTSQTLSGPFSVLDIFNESKLPAVYVAV